ncbi:hypothetical protein C7S15_7650 [Burkholderia cepacia]|nr:hypothetical protein [Burkholderia cepacia]
MAFYAIKMIESGLNADDTTASNSCGRSTRMRSISIADPSYDVALASNLSLPLTIRRGAQRPIPIASVQ